MRREPIRKWLWRHLKMRVPSGPSVNREVNWQKVSGYSILLAVVVLLVLAMAGFVAGAGFFILSMVAMNYLYVAGSSLLLATSVSIILAGYAWLTPEV